MIQKYNYICEFVKAGCTHSDLKQNTNMKIHNYSCNFNYDLTEEKWEVDRIIDVFGNSSLKLFLMQ